MTVQRSDLGHICAISQSTSKLVHPTWCINRFAATLRERQDEVDALCRSPQLRIYEDPAHALEIMYIPFDPVPQPDARLALVGTTPGRTQLALALPAAQQALAHGGSSDDAVSAARRTGAFGGPMRKNLVWMLDQIGVNDALGLPTAARLFDTPGGALLTSAVCHPVFVRGENWNGRTPKLLEHPVLRSFVDDVLSVELAWARYALVIPLGAVAQQAVDRCLAAGRLHARRVLRGFLHPSGANNGRIHGQRFQALIPSLMEQVRRWAPPQP